MNMRSRPPSHFSSSKLTRLETECSGCCSTATEQVRTEPAGDHAHMLEVHFPASTRRRHRKVKRRGKLLIGDKISDGQALSHRLQPTQSSGSRACCDLSCTHFGARNHRQDIRGTGPHTLSTADARVINQHRWIVHLVGR